MSDPAYFRTNLKITRITDEDVSGAIELWRQCGLTRPWNDPERDISLARACPTAMVFVGKVNDVLVATTLAGFDGHRGWLYYAAVDPCLQRNGIGGLMVRHAEQWLRDSGAPKIHLQIRTENQAVANFYRKLGYADQNLLVMGKRFEIP